MQADRWPSATSSPRAGGREQPGATWALRSAFPMGTRRMTVPHEVISMRSAETRLAIQYVSWAVVKPATRIAVRNEMAARDTVFPWRSVSASESAA